jgi:hypothetical protein
MVQANAPDALQGGVGGEIGRKIERLGVYRLCRSARLSSLSQPAVFFGRLDGRLDSDLGPLGGDDRLAA